MFKHTCNIAAMFLALFIGAITPTWAQTSGSKSTLYIVEACSSTSGSGRCELELVQVPTGSPAPSQAQTTCAVGWVAHLMAEQGTVEQGGINRGASIVCGHSSAESALRAAVKVCNDRTIISCNEANRITVRWAQWSGDTFLSTQQPGIAQKISVDQLPGAQSCSSAIPLQESDQCPAVAAVQLRGAGIR